MGLILQLEYLDVLWGTGKAEYIRPYVGVGKKLGLVSLARAWLGS